VCKDEEDLMRHHTCYQCKQQSCDMSGSQTHRSGSHAASRSQWRPASSKGRLHQEADSRLSPTLVHKLPTERGKTHLECTPLRRWPIACRNNNHSHNRRTVTVDKICTNTKL
jgi:hypothetical protein